MTAAVGISEPQHHPDEGVLMDYAAGAAHEGAGVLIATHLALCPTCRATVKRLESLGGALVADLPPSPLDPALRTSVLAQLDEPEAKVAPRPAPAVKTSPQPIVVLPRPLRDYAGGTIADLPWRRVGPGIELIELTLGGAARQSAKERAEEHMRLFRIGAGHAIPRHTHHGTEMVLVLSGGFRDGGRQFRRGDVSLSDQQIDHSPKVDKDADCICLSVTDAPLRLTGLVGRILNLFVRF